MTRKVKTVGYEAALDQTVSLREALPASHLARFVVDVVAELDVTGTYERYGLRGGEAYAPELLLALLLYGYATGVFSSRKIEKATYESLPLMSGSHDPSWRKYTTPSMVVQLAMSLRPEGRRWEDQDWDGGG